MSKYFWIDEHGGKIYKEDLWLKKFLFENYFIKNVKFNCFIIL